MRARVAYEDQTKEERALILEKKEEKSQPDRIFFGKILLPFLNSGYERENYYRHVTVAQPRDYE